MGLDMHLFDKNNNEVIYWRKANQIHNWFVENVQDGVDDCCENIVTECNLIDLMNTCKNVLDNPTEANNILPCTTGFFFGSQEYDVFYFDNIAYTYNHIKDIIDNCQVGDYWTYRSCW
jgi:hypothetical protein